jgi:uncharacterized protein (DUF2336 family)
VAGEELPNSKMPAAQPLLPNLDDLVKGVSPERRAVAVRKLGMLFAQSAERFNPQHVALFDGILKGLLFQSGSEVRAELSMRLASLVNAPPQVVRELVQDDEIRVSGPILQASPLVDEPTLIEIARRKGQEHLLAISQRDAISENVTDVILRRGDREVVRSVARNATAVFSTRGHTSLVQRAANDGMLAVAVGQRVDLPAPMLQRLLSESVDLVRRKMFQAASPSRKTTIARTMVEISDGGPARPSQRDFAAAQKEIVDLHKAGGLDQEALAQFARDRKVEETVVALAAISGLLIATVEQIVCGPKRDSVLILGRALGLEWATVRTFLPLRLAAGRTPSPADLEEARVGFERLALTTAQRMLKFWKDRGQT